MSKHGFGRFLQVDERNRSFPMSVQWGDTPPEIVSRVWTLNERLDQGTDGACVGFAYAHELLAEPVRVLVGTEDAIKIYHEAQKIDPWPGGAYPGADPFYEGTSMLAGVKIVKGLGHYTGYLWATSEADIARTIAHNGPVVLGVDWYQGMYDTDANGFIHPTGSMIGGHAVVLVGIDVEGGFYWGVNSWGPRWGQGGAFKIRREDVELLVFQRNGEAVKPIRYLADDTGEFDPVVDDETQPEPEPAPEPADRCGLLCKIVRYVRWLFGV